MTTDEMICRAEAELRFIESLGLRADDWVWDDRAGTLRKAIHIVEQSGAERLAAIMEADGPL